MFEATEQMMAQARLALEGPALERLETEWAEARPHFGDRIG